MSKAAADPIEKFWSNVLPEPNSSGCWLWTGTLWPNGYGSHQYGGRKNKAELAHRFSYRDFKHLDTAFSLLSTLQDMS